MVALRGSLLSGTASLTLESPTSGTVRARSRSNSREPTWRTSRSNQAHVYETEALRADVAALKKAVKSIAELLQTNSQESKERVLSLCAALTD